MIIALITSQVDNQLGVSCLILVSQHYHQVIHNCGQHGSSRRLNPAGMHYCSHTYFNSFCRSLAHLRGMLAEYPTLCLPFTTTSPRTTCIEERLIKPHTPGDPHSTVRPYLPKCRLQKIHLGTRGTHLHMMQQMESPN